MIHAFPKIFAIGTTYIQDIFKDDVEITEKVDGSQFNFGKINGEFFMRSKGQQIFPDNPDKMFQQAVDYVVSIQDSLPDNCIHYCEYLQKAKHNNLKYERIPKNHLALFGVSDETGNFIGKYELLKVRADAIGVDVVPLVFVGKISSPDELFALIERQSFLGGTSIEGVVVKNYQNPFLLGGQPIPIMMGKYVSEKYKEVAKGWHERNTGKGKWDVYKEGFRTEARWDKAIQHLREAGTLENSPRDIGILLKEIQRDVAEEEKENIKEFLWKEFGSEVLRKAVGGFPEYYKDKLVKESFDETTP
jgi:hypothetical protein